MNDSDQHSHIGLLFQMEMMFQSCPFQCLITREAQKEGSNTSVCYKAVLLNKKKVSGDQFIGLLFEAFHVGQGIVFPVELPSLNYLVVEQEKYIQKENDKISLEDQEGKVSKLISDARLTKVHIGLGGVGRTDSLGTLDFWIKSKKNSVHGLDRPSNLPVWYSSGRKCISGDGWDQWHLSDVDAGERK